MLSWLEHLKKEGPQNDDTDITLDKNTFLCSMKSEIRFMYCLCSPTLGQINCYNLVHIRWKILKILTIIIQRSGHFIDLSLKFHKISKHNREMLTENCAGPCWWPLLGGTMIEFNLLLEISICKHIFYNLIWERCDHRTERDRFDLSFCFSIVFVNINLSRLPPA